MAANFWISAGLFATSWGISWLLKPKADEEEPPEKPQFLIPQSEPGPPHTIFGRVRIDDPRLLWRGQLTDPDDPPEVLIDGRVVAYRYYAHVVVQWGLRPTTTLPVRLYRHFVDGRNPFPSSAGNPSGLYYAGGLPGLSPDVDSDTSRPLSFTDYFGGPGLGGGLKGDFTYHDGGPTEAIDTNLQDAWDAENSIDPSHPPGTLVPAYHGRIVTYFRASWGESPTLPSLGAELEVLPNSLTGNLGHVVRPPGTFTDHYVSFIGANPLEIAYTVLVDEWVGCGIDPAAIDMASFVAAAQQCQTEHIGLNFAWRQRQPARRILEEIAKVIDASIYKDPFDGVIRVKLIRDDYDIETIPHFDESNSELLSYAVADWKSTTNEVTAVYFDQEENQDKASQPQQDQANIVFTGGVRDAKISYLGVTDAQLAADLASRDLRAMSQPLDRIQLRTNRDGTALREGFAFTYSNTRLGMDNVVFRAGRPDFGSLAKGEVTFDAIRDSFDAEERGVGGQPVAPQPPAIQSSPPGCIATSSSLVAEVPRWHAARLGLGSPEASRIMCFAAKPSNATSYSLQTKWPSGNPLLANTFTVLRSSIPFGHRFVVETDYSRFLEPYDDSTGLRVTMNAAARATLASATAAQIRNGGANLMMVGVPPNVEIMAFEFVLADGLDDVLENVWRGLLDTAPLFHPAGTPGWLLPASDTSLHVAISKIFDGDELITSRLIPRNANVALDAGRAPLIEQTLEARAARPYPPQYFELDGSNNPGDVIENELYTTYRRRKRTSALINRGMDFDDREDGTTYVIRGEVVAPYAPKFYYAFAGVRRDWAPLNPVSAGGAVGIDDDEAYVPLEELSHGPTEIHILAGMDDPTPGEDGPGGEVAWAEPGVESFTKPTIPIELKRYRQLLINGGFEDADPTRGWDLDSGTPDADTGVDGGTALGTASAGCTFSQTRKVSPYAPAGLRGYTLYFRKRDVSYAINITLAALDSGGSVLASDTTGDITGSGDDWEIDLLSVECPPGTVALRTTVVCTGGGASWRGVDAFRMYLADAAPDIQVLGNGTFDSDLTGWTVDSGSWASSSVANMSGGQGLRCTSGTGEVYRDYAVPNNGHQRGVAHALSWRQSDGAGSADEMQIVLEARDVSETVLASVSGSLTVDNDGNWHAEDLFLELDDDTIDHLRYRIVSVTNAVTANEYSVDNCLLFLHRELHPVHVYEDFDFQEPAEQVFPVVPTCPANTQANVWLLQDEASSGVLADARGQQGANFVCDTALLRERTAAGINDSVLGMHGRKAIESHAGLAVGVGASVTSTAILDAGDDATGQSIAVDILFRSAVKPADIAGIISKRVAGGAGWGLYLTSTGNFQLYAETTEGASNEVFTSGVDFCDRAQHLIRLILNRTTNHLRLRSDLHNPDPVLIPDDLTADGAFLALFGHTDEDRPESFAPCLIQSWVGAEAEARDDADDFAEAWTHASDPTDKAVTYGVVDAVAARIGTGTAGEIWGAFAPGQVPIGTDGEKWGAWKWDGQTNLVDPDPNSDDWTADEVPAGPAVPNENGFYLPETIAESTALGGTLDHIWLMQASGSPIEDEQTAGTDYDATAAGTGGAGGFVDYIAYQQSVAGWSRYFVRLDDTGDATQRFIQVNDPVDITTTSFVMMGLIELGALTTSSMIMQPGNAGALTVTVLSTTGCLRLSVNGTTYDGSYVFLEDGDVHMVALEWDVRVGAEDCRVSTDEETIEGAYDAGVGNLAAKRLFGGNQPRIQMWCGWAAMAVDTNAEALIDANPITVYTV